MRCFIIFITLLVISLGQAENTDKKAPENTLPKLSETGDTLKELDSDLDLDGSGDDYYDDDDDYDDEDYDEDDPDFDPDNYPDGSGDYDEDDEDIAKLIPDESDNKSTTDDIHFAEEEGDDLDSFETDETSKNKKKTNEDDLLYEYYNEYFEEDYEDLQDEVDELNKEIESVMTPKIEPEPEKPGFTFQPSYIFLIIASALVSFTMFMVAFLICRRSVAARRQKKLMPFVVNPPGGPTRGFHTPTVPSSTPIVKNYQRVPTSTKEFLHQNQPEVHKTESQKPLLFKS